MTQSSPAAPNDGVSDELNTRSEDRLSLFSKIAYGVGSAPDPILSGTIGQFTMVFYNGVLGLSGSTVGWILFAPRLWDAVTDPWLGKISDNTRSRFGRRRPFALVGGVFTAILYFLLWIPPRTLSDMGTIVYLLIVSCLFFTAYTVYNVPYAALGYEMTPDYRERTRLMAWRRFLSNGGEMLVVSMPIVAAWWTRATGRVDDERFGYGAAGATFAVLVTACILFAVWGTRERAEGVKAGDLSLWQSFRYTFRNILFLRLAAAVFFLVLAIILLAQNVNYLLIFYVERPDLIFWVGVAGATVGAFAAFGWASIANAIGKSRGLVLAQSLVVAASLSTFFVIEPRLPWLALSFGLVNGIGWSGINVIAPSLIADIVDFDELHTGQRREGSYSGVFGFVFKVGIAASMPVLGMSLDWLGFDPELGAAQSPETFFRMRLATAVGAALFAVLGVMFLLRFPLTPQRALEVRRELERRRGESSTVI